MSVDPCFAPSSFSLKRFLLFLPCFLMMFMGMIPFLWFRSDPPLGIYLASLVGYTSAVILYTFSANRGSNRFLFTCTKVGQQYPKLARTHLVFACIFLAVLAGTFQIQPHLSSWWIVASGAPKSLPPIVYIREASFWILAIIEIITNRSILQQSHTKCGK